MDTTPLDLVNPDSVRERLMSRLTSTIPDECWLWIGAKDGSGYGTMAVKLVDYPSRYGWRAARTHRIMWTLANGPIPDGMVIDHTCLVRACCNPSHLQVVTQSQNVRLQAERTLLRATCPKCGGSDWKLRGTSKQRICRPCSRDYRREWQRRLKAPASCPRCGEAFPRTRQHMTYCSDACSPYTVQDRERSQRYRAKHRDSRD